MAQKSLNEILQDTRTTVNEIDGQSVSTNTRFGNMVDKLKGYEDSVVEKISDIKTKLNLNDDNFTYEHIFNEWKDFKKANNPYETYGEPVNWWFKIFFYFKNSNEQAENVGVFETSNLLGIDSQQIVNDGTINTGAMSNTAYAFLLRNGEVERANLLLNFISLLSNIATSTPWYFQSIEGLGEALKREYTLGKEFKINEEPKTITINCLQDPYDTRLTTMFDCYKAACFSHITKRVIIPANLRKFDMGIYLYTQPISKIHYPTLVFDGLVPKINADWGGKLRSVMLATDANQLQSFASIGKDDLGSKYYQASYKYFELHNCEFDYNSLCESFSTLSNVDGIKIEPKIKINFDEIYEMRFNEFTLDKIGDILYIDSLTRESNKTLTETINNKLTELQDPEKHPVPTQIFTSGNVGDDLGVVGSKVVTAASNLIMATLKKGIDAAQRELITKFLTGNVYGLSINQIKRGAKAVVAGNPFAIADIAGPSKKKKKTPTIKKNVYQSLV